VDAVSQTLLRLADPVSRPELLGSESLLAIAALCYDVDSATAVDAATAMFDRFDLAVPIQSELVGSGRMSRTGDPLPWEFSAVLNGVIPPVPGADAVWAGRIVVRIGTGDGLVDDVVILPPDRSTAPGLGAGGPENVGVQVHLTAPEAPTAETSPLLLPVVVAFVVADESTSPGDLVWRTTLARRAAGGYPILPRPAHGPVRKAERCVCWLVPATAFDDAGWPGATSADPAQQRAERLAAARSSLATQAVAIVTT
jgi:hypothetical protein